jgi:nucleotide-binding universal stress UspA family protein
LEDYYPSPEWRGYVLEHAKADLARLLETGGVNGETHIEVGSISGGVADVAKQVQADLLVIGRTSHGIAGGRLPTNAYAIIRESPCPVLSI